MPKLAQNSRDQAPPASTTASQAIAPRSVTTPLIRPAVRSTPRTAHWVRITGPSLCAARAMAGTAFCGSA